MRERITRKIEGIQALLEPEPSSTIRTAQPSSPASNGTWRSRILSVLHELNRPASAPEIAKILKSRGTKDRGKGKTSVTTIVSSALWRMDQKAQDNVTRVGHGEYVIKNGGGPSE